GMRGVAEASLANSFPATHPAQRAAYQAIYLGKRSGGIRRVIAGAGATGDDLSGLGSDPGAGTGCLRGARFPVAIRNWPPGRRPHTGREVRGDGGRRAFSAFAGTADLGPTGARISRRVNRQVGTTCYRRA